MNSSPSPCLDPLLALSPLDGRYATKVEPLRAHLSEFALLRWRVWVEAQWFLALAQAELPQKPQVAPALGAALLARVQAFSLADAQAIKAIERRTNHDVKAVEYWFKQLLREEPALRELEPQAEWLHFACTSEDINNTAYALMLREARAQALLPALAQVRARLRRLAAQEAATPMLARTHGQSASPTTLGKEMANVDARLARVELALREAPILAKFNGAVGNFNAHSVAFPTFDWPAFSARFIQERLGLTPNPMSTQIEPHDWIGALLDAQARINTILLDLARDVWGYVALGYFQQQVRDNEVGSSAMPHKVNPIDFENAEGNLGLANAMLRHMSDKLPVSRWQRDLSDSTVLRSLGVALGYAQLAMDSLVRGLDRLSVRREALRSSVDAAWEVLAEAVQTTMRRWGLPEPYEQLKALTRGHATSQQSLHQFIRACGLPPAEQQRLLALVPAAYTGLAERLTHDYLQQTQATMPGEPS